jgi:beta-glucosidase
MAVNERERGGEPASAADSDVERLVAALTLDEKAALTAGADMWSTVAVERLGIPKVRVTDGPNGARGPWLRGEVDSVSTCVPCGSALGATWDTELLERVGAILATEARAKGCRVLLAPTVNIHRSPLAGRNFECYSEDPILSGRLAVAFIRGAQSHGVATTVKHFVGNDAETERYTMSSEIGPRALREIYLRPFELAVVEGGSLGLMTAYNRVNGVWCSEHRELLEEVLRGEWGFDGFVISDWYATASPTGSARAGLDLEMPGPGRAFGPALAAAVRAGEVEEAVVDAQVARLLHVFERVGASTGDDQAEPAGVDTPEHRAVAHEAAVGGVVLLKNEAVLPLASTSLRSLAVIGQNAGRAVVMGGGSSQVQPPYRVTPLQALRERLGDAITLTYEPGVDIDTTVPPLTQEMSVDLFATPDLRGDVVETRTHPTSELVFVGPPRPDLSSGFSFRATTRFLPPEAGRYAFTLAQAGRARLLVDGTTVLDGFVDPPPRGGTFFGLGSDEIEATVELAGGREIDVVIEYSSDAARGFFAAKVGCRMLPPADLLERAERAAASADAAIVVVGTTNDWETEGRDRDTMDLPGAQDELVARVVAANPNTVVVVNAGAPVTMPWAGDAGAVLQAWFGGQEMARALVDVLLGDEDPGGRLPTTLPLVLEHNPSFGNFPGENDEVHYGEGVLVGYRWYDARRLPVRFPFGHGLSYTTFTLGAPRCSATELAVDDVDARDVLTVDVDVTNMGARAGTEVVQCYVAPLAPRLTRPPKELEAFAKVRLDAGATTTVTLSLDGRAFAYWDPGAPDHDAIAGRQVFSGQARAASDHAPEPGWRVDPGAYELRIGRSSADIAHIVRIEITRTS